MMSRTLITLLLLLILSLDDSLAAKVAGRLATFSPDGIAAIKKRRRKHSVRKNRPHKRLGGKDGGLSDMGTGGGGGGGSAEPEVTAPKGAAPPPPPPAPGARPPSQRKAAPGIKPPTVQIKPPTR